MKLTPKKVKGIRKKLGLTQVELAAKLGVAFATVNRWENGQCEPSPLASKMMRMMLIMEEV